MDARIQRTFWRARRDANSRDYLATTLLATAGVLCGLAPIFRGQSLQDARAGFTWVSGVVAMAFFAAMVAIWTEEYRHGVARALSAAGAAVLGIGALAYTGQLPGLTLLSYWIPAILAMVAAMVLFAGKRAELRGHS